MQGGARASGRGKNSISWANPSSKLKELVSRLLELASHSHYSVLLYVLAPNSIYNMSPLQSITRDGGRGEKWRASEFKSFSRVVWSAKWIEKRHAQAIDNMSKGEMKRARYRQALEGGLGTHIQKVCVYCETFSLWVRIGWMKIGLKVEQTRQQRENRIF